MISFFQNIWRKNLLGKFTVVFFLLIFLAVIVFTSYGIMTRQGDLGFIEIGEIKLTQSKDSLPLLCSVDDTTSIEELKLVKRAMQSWNDESGKQLFMVPCMQWVIEDPMPLATEGFTLRVGKPIQSPIPPGEVEVIVENSFKSHTGAVTRHFYDTKTGEIKRSAVFIDPQHKDKYEVYVHELGHVLGLADDDLADSVMYKSYRKRVDKPSSKDIDLIVKTYYE